MPLLPDDMDAYDWNWYAKYGDEVTAELITMFEDGAVIVAPNLSPERLQVLSSEWASQRAGDLLKIDGPNSLAITTKTRVKELVSQSITKGESLGRLNKNLREDLMFSKARATMIAQTETTIALGQGGKQAAVNTGQEEKSWQTQGSNVDVVCIDNEAAGWIPINESFPSGNETIPAHVNCRCNVIYRMKQGV